MLLYNLGKVPWEESQLIYHALAMLNREALSLVSPASPYVCIGYHQDVEQEVDLDYCRENQIPVFRREVGGGAVFLDGNQLFFHLILRRDNPIIPKGINAFYKNFLQPVIDIHHQIGIPVKYKPVNDLVVNSRKISGTGVGEIGDCIVFVGNLIVDFDYESMARVLKIPDEKFRDKVKKTIMENLSTIRRELGDENATQWREDKLNAMMVEAFTGLIGPMINVEMDDELIRKMNDLRKTMLINAWLYRRGKNIKGKVIKVKSGLEIVQKLHKSAGGLLRTEFQKDEGRYKEVRISGDFFCYPKDTIDRLTNEIEDTQTDKLHHVLKSFYDKGGFEMPGVDVEDWVRVL